MGFRFVIVSDCDRYPVFRTPDSCCHRECPAYGPDIAVSVLKICGGNDGT